MNDLGSWKILFSTIYLAVRLQHKCSESYESRLTVVTIDRAFSIIIDSMSACADSEYYATGE